MKSPIKAALLVALALSSILPVAHARLWTNTEGKSFEGDLVEVESNIAVIRRRDDFWTFRVPVKELSEEDQKYVEGFVSKLAEGKKADEAISVITFASIKPKSGFTKVELLKNKAKAWANRNYVWMNIPPELAVTRFVKIPGGSKQSIKADVSSPGYVYIAFSDSDNSKLKSEAWETTGDVFSYSDRSNSLMHVYRKRVETGELEINNLGWSGPVLLLP